MEITKIEEQKLWDLMDACINYVSNIALVEGERPLEKQEILEDRISELPNQLIFYILSFLTIKEAACTTILSRRWRDILRSFMAFTSTLNLDVENMNGYDYPQGLFQGHKRDYILEKRCKFVKWVDKILPLSQRPMVVAFRIQFYLGQESACYLDRWIGDAIDKGVQKLDLDLSMSHRYLMVDNLYSFPCWLFPQEREPHIKYLFLNSCILTLPPDFSAFNSLVSLTLENVHLADEDVDHLLVNCSLLESLRMINCLSIVGLKITTPSIRLKHLYVSWCYNLEYIEIVGICISSFEYVGAMIRFSFKLVPQLKLVCIRTIKGNKLGAMSYALSKLACDLPQLETLYLSSPTIEENMLPTKLPTFSNLKQLVLMTHEPYTESLLQFTTFLKASPFLHKFVLHIHAKRPCREIITEVKHSTSKCPHNQLKEVQICGFGGYRDEIELSLYFLKNATALKVMTLDPKVPFYKGENIWHTITVFELAKTQRENVYKLLCREVPLGAQLIIL